MTASFIPRWFIRTGLFISSFHRDVALRRVFHTVDLYLGGGSNWNPTLDIFDRVKMYALFSHRMKALHIRAHIRTVYRRSEQGEQIDREAHPQEVGRAAYQQVPPHITAAVSSRCPTANEVEYMTSISDRSHIFNLPICTLSATKDS